MIYIVYSTFPRSGTSMMMQCLAAGGLTPFISTERENMMHKHHDDQYIGNSEYMELDNYSDLEQYDNQLIKIVGMRYIYLPKNSQVIIMTRHPEEIRQSYEALKPNLAFIPETFSDNYAFIMNKIKNNKRTNDVIFSYRKILEAPRKHFNILHELNWPINIKKASAKVDGSLCRFKIENLHVGV
jgi:hypothetical protein